MNEDDIKHGAYAVVDLLERAGEEGLSAREIAEQVRGIFRADGGRPTLLLQKILFAHPNIKRIGNTKTTRYVYTDKISEAIPWINWA